MLFFIDRFSVSDFVHLQCGTVFRELFTPVLIIGSLLQCTCSQAFKILVGEPSAEIEKSGSVNLSVSTVVGNKLV
jgi:hypothetical protein